MAIKHVSLLILAIQNSALILVMRYSRTITGPRYIPTTAVLISEIIKTIFSVTLLLHSRLRAKSKQAQAPQESSAEPPDASPSLVRECLNAVLQPAALFPVMLPAVLYTIQNNLQYLAASNLDAATFQTLYQSKVLATAFFAVLILRQRLTIVKWAAIFILTCGIVLISYPSSTPAKVSRRGGDTESRTTGLIAVLIACVISGFTGVFLEFLLKRARDSGKHLGNTSAPSPFWVRNVQLSAASVVIASIAAGLMNGKAIVEDGFFYGYNPVVWATILLQAAGGLVVAIVVTYADNILKGFATSLSLVVSTAISSMTGDVVLTYRFVVGVVLVFGATNLYGISWGDTKKEEISHDQSQHDSISTPLDLENQVHYTEESPGQGDEVIGTTTRANNDKVPNNEDEMYGLDELNEKSPALTRSIEKEKEPGLDIVG